LITVRSGVSIVASVMRSVSFHWSAKRKIGPNKKATLWGSG